MFKAARRKIREAVPLAAKFGYEPTQDGHRGWQLNVESHWYGHGVMLRLYGDKLVVECEDDQDFLELADPAVVTKLAGLLLKHFPGSEWPD